MAFDRLILSQGTASGDDNSRRIAIFVTASTTRPKGIACDIKSDIVAVVDTYQLKVLAAGKIAVMLDHHMALTPPSCGLPVVRVSGERSGYLQRGYLHDFTQVSVQSNLHPKRSLLPLS